MAQAESAIISEKERAAHLSSYTHGLCGGCRQVIVGSGPERAATYIDVSLSGDTRLRYHPHCAPPIARRMDDEPMMCAVTVAPSCAIVDKHEDFLSPLQHIALLRYSDLCSHKLTEH